MSILEIPYHREGKIPCKIGPAFSQPYPVLPGRYYHPRGYVLPPPKGQNESGKALGGFPKDRVYCSIAATP